MNSLLVIEIDKTVKVAQYISNSPPRAITGRCILDFLRRNPPNFAKNVRETRWTKPSDYEEIIKSLEDPYLLTEFSSATGVALLDILADRPIKAISSIEFALDSLFCSFAYVINIDESKLELHSNVFDMPENWEQSGRFRDTFHMEAAAAKSDAFGRKYRPLVELATYDFSVSGEDFFESFIKFEPIY